MNNAISFTTKIIQILSKQRIAGYQKRCGSENNIDLLSYYAWNSALSESLYPALQTLEVSLRNRLHSIISNFSKVDNWLESTALLHFREQEKVREVVIKLDIYHKRYTVDDIIAELKFGFWTSLFDSRYEHQQRLWPKLLKSVFPYMPAKVRTRHFISRRLNKIRYLRNRIYHYEPVWHWHDLSNQHMEIINLLGWLQPDLKDFNNIIDRFDAVYSNGWQSYKKKIASLFNKTNLKMDSKESHLIHMKT